MVFVRPTNGSSPQAVSVNPAKVENLLDMQNEPIKILYEEAAKVEHEIPQEYDGGYFKVGKPYEVNGTQYVPEERYNHTEYGLASWYGPGFNSRPTANGETYDQEELTAAHKTLQIPCFVKVTNLENNKSVIVRINDRGPFADNRIIDLSKKAAEMLHFKDQGLAKVKVEVLTDASIKVALAAKQINK